MASSEDDEPERPEHEQSLHNAALGYWERGTGLGGRDRDFALVLEVLSQIARIAELEKPIAVARPHFEAAEPHLKQLVKAAEAYFRAFPDQHPFSPNRAAGATQILEDLKRLADQREHDGLSLEWMAIHLIGDIPQQRAGDLPTIRAYHDADGDKVEQGRLMGELKDKLVAELARLEPYRKQDLNEWAEKATRAALRVFGDRAPDNALKHLLKK